MTTVSRGAVDSVRWKADEEAFEASKHLFRGLLAIHDDHQRRPGSQDIVLAVKPAYLLRCEGRMASGVPPA